MRSLQASGSRVWKRLDFTHKYMTWVKKPRRYISSTKIKERPLAFVDLEFSGLKLNNEILQIGVVLVSQDDFSVIREWSVKVKPEHIRTGEEKSLKIVGYSAKKWKDAIPLRDALLQLNEMVKDAVLIGYNVAWDFLFLKKSFTEEKIEPTLHWQILDVFSMVYAEYYRTRLDGFRMREMASYMKLKERKWHDALADARVTYDIFMKLMRKNENL